MTARDRAAAAEPLRSLIDVATGGEPTRRRTQKTSERVAGEIVRDIVARGLRSGARLPARGGDGRAVRRQPLVAA